MGMIFEKYQDKNICMHRYNIFDKQVIDCDNDGFVLQGHDLNLSIEEHVNLHGAKIINAATGKKYSTFVWNYDEELKADIDEMWKINIQTPSKWNKMFTAISMYYNRADVPDRSGNTFDANILSSEVRVDILEALENKDLINRLSVNYGHVRFTAKNSQIAEALDKAGNVLELKILSLVKQLQQDGLVNDVMSGVQIDWDGNIHSDYNSDNIYHDTINEIDTIIMNGVTPIFISCKNGSVESEELYKLSTVSKRIGGKYVKKVLFKTGKLNGNAGDYMKQRAKDYDIMLFDNLRYKTDEEILEILKKIIAVR